MLVKKYRSELVSIFNPLSEIYTLEFKSLDGLYKYNPGQFLHLALDTDYDGTGQWPDSRCFSMQNNANDKTIKITYAVKGKYTKLMEQQLHVGREVWLKLPYGDLFTQPHNKENTIFIAGGTGITPFLSLFTHQSFSEYINPRIYLGFRSREHNIYEGQLKIVKLYNPKIFYQDIDGLLDIQLIFFENGRDSNYFISGPPVMITSFREYLMNSGISAKQVLTDDWG
jgi:ferredoxin-NADP reductase